MDELLGRIRRRLFLALPIPFIAEPFEVFVVTLATVDVIVLGLHELQGTDQLFIDYYYDPLGLWLWVVFVMVGNALILFGLAVAADHDSLTVRRSEVAGLLIYSVGFGFYGYTNLAIGLSRPGLPDIYPILGEVIVLSLVAGCLVRALVLSLPLSALAVTRSQRIKLIKESLRSERQ